MLIGEGIFKNFYHCAGMKNMAKLPPLKRLRFWVDLFNILFVGFLSALFLQESYLIIFLVIMNIFFTWWCYKWKLYLSSLN